MLLLLATTPKLVESRVLLEDGRQGLAFVFGSNSSSLTARIEIQIHHLQVVSSRRGGLRPLAKVKRVNGIVKEIDTAKVGMGVADIAQQVIGVLCSQLTMAECETLQG
jgi:hypothetical protein